MTKINEIERARFTEIIDQYSDESVKEHKPELSSCEAPCMGCVKASLVNHIKNYLVMMETI